MQNILFIPIDNRPVCYQLPMDIAKINTHINLIIPPKKIIGNLHKLTEYSSLYNWTKNILQNSKIDYAIISLDTVAYGGLIQSRVSKKNEAEIKKRIKSFIDLFKNKNTKIIATSSIMRISNNNINEEEKDYWKEYGTQIFQYSYEKHKTGKEQNHSIPAEILSDYLRTRNRNFSINIFYTELLKNGLIDYLVFSKDDTGAWGINVQEAQHLSKITSEEKLNADIKTGADEIPLTLLCRSISEIYNEDIKVNPIFSDKRGKDIISRYEDITIEDSTKAQIEACNAIQSGTNNNIELIVNTPTKTQDDLALGIQNDLTSTFKLNLPKKYFVIADIKNANGADNKLIEQLMKEKINKNLLGYAGWNTTGNTLGSCLAMSIVTYISKKHNHFSEKHFKKAMAKRLLDDWAYQANIRQQLRASENSQIEKAFNSYVRKIEAFLDMSLEDISFKLPWNRTFEVEICLDDND